MAREVQEHTIGETTYKIQTLGSKLGKKVLARMLRVVGPAFESDSPAEKLAEALTDEQLDFLCDTFAASTRFSPTDNPALEFDLKLQFDDHFAGKYGLMARWLWAAIQTNYASFFGELGLTPERMAELLTQAKSEIGSPNLNRETSPSGPYGASSVRAGASSPK